MILKNYHLPAICLCLACFACKQQPVDLFTDVTTQSGIDFLYTFGDTTYENILESSGSGVTVFDYDGDGDMDIYMLNGTWLEGISDPSGKIYANTPNALYRNNGDGTFTEVAQQAGVDDRHWSMAAGAVDYDADGDMDLYLMNYGPNIFYLNNGDGTFSDITADLGLQGPDTLNGFPKWSVSVAFWDENRDGLLDLMLGNFLAFDPDYHSPGHPDIMPHPSEYKGQASLFYHQDADGTFEDLTRQRGLYRPDSKCMGLAVFDDDQDGDIDIFQANDHQPNFLFQNEGRGVYSEMGVARGVAVNDDGAPTGSMHPSLGDVDGDGLIDVLVTDLEHGALYRNLGNGVFEDITEQSGLSVLFEGKGAWAGLLFDYDNDGDLDLFSADGVADVLGVQYPLLLENNGAGVFTNAGAKGGAYFRQQRSGRGAAVLDYDNDGDMDIIVSHVDLKRTPALLQNRCNNGNHWIGLTLLNRHGKPSWPGSKLRITAGGKTQVLIDQPGNAYLSFCDTRVHAGLGQATQVDNLEVTWPDRTTDVFENIPADQYFNIRQGSGKQ